MYKTVQTSQIAHESETQRQYIRLAIPAQIEIQGVYYPLKDLSSGGFGIKTIRGHFSEDRLIPVILRLTFPQFTMDIALDAQVRHYDPDTQTMGCRFVNIAPEQISSINHVLTSFMAGSIVGSSDMLAIAGRDNFTKARLPASRKGQTTVPNLRRQIPGMLIILALGSAALVVIGSNLYDRFFTAKSREAMVLSEKIDLRTQIGGFVEFSLPADTVIVTEGDQIATVDTGGLMPKTRLTSPCNCYIAERYARNGEYLKGETPVVRLIPIAAKPWIRATLPYTEASRLKIDQKADIRIYGMADAYEGRITDMKSIRTEQEAMVQIDVMPDKRVPIDLAERPASVVFHTR